MLANMVMLRPFDHVQRREREELASTFEEISEVMAEELLQMVNEAKVVLRLLNRLDTAQNALHDMILKEKKIVKRDRDELVRVYVYLGILACYLLRLAFCVVLRVNCGHYWARNVGNLLCLLSMLTSWSRCPIPEASSRIASGKRSSS